MTMLFRIFFFSFFKLFLSEPTRYHIFHFLFVHLFLIYYLFTNSTLALLRQKRWWLWAGNKTWVKLIIIIIITIELKYILMAANVAVEYYH